MAGTADRGAASASAGCRARRPFTFLLTATGLTKGNLASNLATLEEAGLVIIEKEARPEGVRTTVRLTGKGREAIERHWERLEHLKTQVFTKPATTI